MLDFNTLQITSGPINTYAKIFITILLCFIVAVFVISYINSTPGILILNIVIAIMLLYWINIANNTRIMTIQVQIKPNIKMSNKYNGNKNVFKINDKYYYRIKMQNDFIKGLQEIDLLEDYIQDEFQNTIEKE